MMTTDFKPENLLGSGRVAEVFAHGANVIKLYRLGQGKKEAFREAATLAVLEESGLPIHRSWPLASTGSAGVWK